MENDNKNENENTDDDDVVNNRKKSFKLNRETIYNIFLLKT